MMNFGMNRNRGCKNFGIGRLYTLSMHRVANPCRFWIECESSVGVLKSKQKSDRSRYWRMAMTLKEVSFAAQKNKYADNCWDDQNRIAEKGASRVVRISSIILKLSFHFISHSSTKLTTLLKKEESFQVKLSDVKFLIKATTYTCAQLCRSPSKKLWDESYLWFLIIWLKIWWSTGAVNCGEWHETLPGNRIDTFHPYLGSKRSC